MYACVGGRERERQREREREREREKQTDRERKTEREEVNVPDLLAVSCAALKASLACKRDSSFDRACICCVCVYMCVCLFDLAWYVCACV